MHQGFVDVCATLVITADAQRRGSRAIPLKSAVDEALADEGGEAVAKVVVYRRAGINIAWNDERDVWLHDLEAGQPDTCAAVAVEAEHPLLIDRKSVV